jgi:Cys-rich repeat protein
MSLWTKRVVILVAASLPITGPLPGCGGPLGCSSNADCPSGETCDLLSLKCVSGGVSDAGVDAGTNGGCNGACGNLCGSWKVTQVTCAGATVPTYTNEYTPPNSIVYSISSSTVTQISTINGCTLTAVEQLACSGSGSFSSTATGQTIQCSPASCSPACGTPLSQAPIAYTYAVSGSSLTLTSSNSTFCTANNQPVVITSTLTP